MISPTNIIQKEAQAKTKLLKDQAQSAQTEYDDLQLKISNSKNVLDDNAQLLKDQQKEHKTWLKEKQSEVESITEKAKKERKKLKKVNESISERQDYLKSQEEAVELAVDNFNNKLRELQSDIVTIENQKETSLQSLAELNSQIQDETKKVDDIQKRYEKLTKFYEETSAKYKVELRTLQTQINQAVMNKNKILEDGRVTLERLLEKEKELTIRENVLNEREANQAEEADYLKKKRVFMEKQ